MYCNCGKCTGIVGTPLMASIIAECQKLVNEMRSRCRDVAERLGMPESAPGDVPSRLGIHGAAVDLRNDLMRLGTIVEHIQAIL